MVRATLRIACRWPIRPCPTASTSTPSRWKILEGLQQNARLSFAELGRKIGLSTPAVAERVHRLEEAGVITGYHASLDSAKLGVPIRVLVRLTIPGGELQISRTVTALKELSEISRCHRITGAESFVIEADVVSIRHLEALIDRLSRSGPPRPRRCCPRRWSGGTTRRSRSRRSQNTFDASQRCASLSESRLRSDVVDALERLSQRLRSANDGLRWTFAGIVAHHAAISWTTPRKSSTHCLLARLKDITLASLLRAD